MQPPSMLSKFRVLKWPLYVLAMFLVLHVLFRAPDEVHADQSGNILKNGDFELQDKSPVPGWLIEQSTEKQGHIAIAAGPVHSGLHSLELAPNGSNVNSGAKNGPLRVAQGFPAGSLRGKKLYVSGWLAAEGGATAVLGALVLEGNGVVHNIELRQETSPGGLR